MPYGVGAFFLFGVGSLPAGRLGDLWGRRRMMQVFFFGIGAAALVVALTQNTWQLAVGLTLIGAFASIYHPVGIPMLVQRGRHPGSDDRHQRLFGKPRRGRRGVADRLLHQVVWLACRLRDTRAVVDRLRRTLFPAVSDRDRAAGQAQGRGAGGYCRERCSRGRWW